MGKIYDFSEIPKQTGKTEYDDFVAWWNKKYKNKMNLDRYLENPFSIRYILYLLYFQNYETIDEDVIKRIMHNLKPTVDYVKDTISDNAQLDQSIVYIKEAEEEISENDWYLEDFVNNVSNIFNPNAKSVNRQMFYDFSKRYHKENKEYPTIQMLINYGIESIILEYILSFDIDFDRDDFMEILDNTLFELNDEKGLAYIIPSDLKNSRQKSYTQLINELKSDPSMNEIIKIADIIVENSDEGIEEYMAKLIQLFINKM
jgi:hypothetical protein